jgi:hypothetical protein
MNFSHIPKFEILGCDRVLPPTAVPSEIGPMCRVLWAALMHNKCWFACPTCLFFYMMM